MTICFCRTERSSLLLFRQIKHRCHIQKRRLIEALRNWTQPIHPTGAVSGGVVAVTRSRTVLIQDLLLRRQVKQPGLTWRTGYSVRSLAKRVGERWQGALILVQPGTIL